MGWNQFDPRGLGIELKSGQSTDVVGFVKNCISVLRRIPGDLPAVFWVGFRFWYAAG
jgi:hypothetical protein